MSPRDKLAQCVQEVVDGYIHTLPQGNRGDLYQLVMQTVEREMIGTVMHHTHNNLSVAARILGIARGTLYKKRDDTRLEVAEAA